MTPAGKIYFEGREIAKIDAIKLSSSETIPHLDIPAGTQEIRCEFVGHVNWVAYWALWALSLDSAE